LTTCHRHPVPGRGWERLPLHKDYFAKGILWKKSRLLFVVVLFGYTLPIKAYCTCYTERRKLKRMVRQAYDSRNGTGVKTTAKNLPLSTISLYSRREQSARLSLQSSEKMLNLKKFTVI
jgi:hypothetical protein